MVSGILTLSHDPVLSSEELDTLIGAGALVIFGLTCMAMLTILRRTVTA